MMGHRTFRHFGTWVLVLSLGFASEAAKVRVEKEKRIERNYAVSDNTQIQVSNKFGTVHIDTWNELRVTVEIVILVEKRSEEAAQRILDNIDIEIDDQNPSRYLAFRTEIRRGSSSNNDGQRFEINYNISIPRRNNLTVDNKHGDIYLGAIDGEVELRLAHGRIRTEELNGKSSVDLSFSEGRMKKMAKGSLELQHTSGLDIDVVGNVEVDIRHTSMSIGEAELLDIKGQHSSVDIDKAQSLDGDFQHSELEINEIVKLATLQAQHSDLDINRVHSGFDLVDLDGGFSDFRIYLDPEASGSIDARMQFGELSYHGGDFDFTYISQEHNLSEYRGKFGSNDESTSKVLIRTQHGDAELVVDD